MKILFVDNSPGMGGSIHHLACQIRPLARLGHDPGLIASDPELFGGLIPDGVPVFTISWPGFRNVFESTGALCKPLLPGPLNKPFSLAAYRALKSALLPEFREVVRRFKPDIVHINNLNLPNKVFADALAPLAVPLVVSALMVRLFSRTEAAFARRADALTCISRAVAQCVGRLPGVEGRRLHVVESALDAEPYRRGRDPRIREELGIPENAWLVLSLGRMIPWKGHEVLIRALARLPDRVWLLQAGGDEPDCRRRIDELVEKSGLAGRVVCAGIRSDVPELLAASDLLAHSSRFSRPEEGVVEAFGRVVIEGMAAGLPVVATDAGGVPEILKGTGAGILVPPGDDVKMAEALEFYLRHPEAAREAGVHGRRVVTEKYGEAPLAEKLALVYESVARGGGLL